MQLKQPTVLQSYDDETNIEFRFDVPFAVHKQGIYQKVFNGKKVKITFDTFDMQDGKTCSKPLAEE